jgi:hypothetical protein
LQRGRGSSGSLGVTFKLIPLTEPGARTRKMHIPASRKIKIQDESGRPKRARKILGGYPTADGVEPAGGGGGGERSAGVTEWWTGCPGAAGAAGVEPVDGG